MQSLQEPWLIVIYRVDNNIARAAEVELNFVRKKDLKVIAICVTQWQNECTASLRGGAKCKEYRNDETSALLASAK